MTRYSRRDLLKSTSLAGVAVAVVPAGVAGAQPRTGADDGSTAAAQAVLRFFSAEEAQFVSAAIDRLIPPDEQWDGAADAGVLHYIDLQLASAYGAGARLYLDGPWDPEAPAQQGYQLKYTPAELYRVAIGEIRDYVKRNRNGEEFWDLDDGAKDGVLAALEMGEVDLPSLPSAVFFETLLANTIEGYFSDPVYGGNRDMVSWRMIGFPGAFAQYADLVDRHGYEFKREPIGIANGATLLSHHPE